jgi:hypothetical protein
MRKKMANFADLDNHSVWETLEQRRKVTRLCDDFKANTAERAWKATWNTFQGSCNLSRDNHDKKIRAKKQRTDIGKYSFTNKIIKH